MYVLEVPYFDLEEIYKSGQAFRWIKLNDKKYIIPLRDKALKVEQQRQRIIFDCTEEAFFERWWDYFDFEVDYQALNNAIKFCDESFKIPANRAKGVHILKQDLFEVIISCCLETVSSIQKTEQMVKGIARKIGVKHKQSMKEAGQVVWYEFPTPEIFLQKQNLLTTQEVGYKKETLLGLCELILTGWLDFEFLRSLSYEEAKSYLMEFNGIEPKAADSICLYGLHHLQAFPVDIHIEQIARRSKMTSDEYLEWFVGNNKRVNENRGVLRQYLWYNEVYPPERMEDWLK